MFRLQKLSILSGHCPFIILNAPKELSLEFLIAEIVEAIERYCAETEKGLSRQEGVAACLVHGPHAGH
jgi:hypothetical protein